MYLSVSMKKEYELFQYHKLQFVHYGKLCLILISLKGSIGT